MEREAAEHRIGVEFIYRYVWSLEGRKAGLPGLLRQRKRRRGRGRRRGSRLPIPNRVPIQARPENANLRSEIGHWEGDVMHFRKGGQALLTLEDRASRLTLARRLRGMGAGDCARAIVAELLPLPPPARRTLTCDNGGEFAHHEHVTLLDRDRGLLLRSGLSRPARLDREHPRPHAQAPAAPHQPRGGH